MKKEKLKQVYNKNDEHILTDAETDLLLNDINNMGKEEIVKKAVEKAVENGWHKEELEGHETEIRIGAIGVDISAIYVMDAGDRDSHPCIYIGEVNDILFDQSFCKAFFGEEKVCSYCGRKESDIINHFEWFNHATYILSWKCYGQQMFLAEDRLKYIKDFL